MSNSIFVFDERKVKELPMVEIAYEILKQSKNNYFFNDLAKEIAKIKNLSDDEFANSLAQLFTEINIDGRFVHLGQNEWGLKSWYPIDQAETLQYTRDEDDEDDEDDTDYDIDDEETDDDYEIDDEEEDDDEADDEDDQDDDKDEEDDDELYGDEIDDFDQDEESFDEELSEDDDEEVEDD